jgi:hypothetical protein
MQRQTLPFAKGQYFAFLSTEKVFREPSSSSTLQMQKRAFRAVHVLWIESVISLFDE